MSLPTDVHGEKWILKKQDGMVWIDLFGLELGPVGYCAHDNDRKILSTHSNGHG
jgi:hypothetical protein